MAGFVAAQDDQGWYDTGDLGYLTENGHSWSAAGSKTSSSWPAGTSTRPTSNAPPPGFRRSTGLAVAVRLDAGHSQETFAVAVESVAWEKPAEVRRIERQVAHEVVAEVDVRPRNVVVLKPGMIPKTPSGKLRRANALALVD